MIKKCIVAILILLNTNVLNANVSKIALEIARSKQIDVVIKRVNNIYDFINLYIIETASLPTNFNALVSQYPGLSNMGYTSSNTIDFSIYNNIVNFTNIVPNNLSNLSKQLYNKNQYLHPNAKVNILTDLSIDIGLEISSRKFLAKSSLLEANDVSNVISVTDVNPGCTNNLNLGTLWYRPDSNGAYFIYTCVLNAGTWQWNFISNKTNVEIYRDTMAQLSVIRPLKGTIAYVKDTLDPNLVNQYIYTGDDGNAATNDWHRVTTP